MKIPAVIASLMLSSTLYAVEWSIELCSSLDLLAGRTGIADVRPSNDPHHNSAQMMEQNSGIYRGQWSWQSEMPELLYGIMHSGEAAKVSPSGFTALHAACVYADENLFNALVDAGVPVDARPGDWQQLGYVGDTPLGLLVRFMNSRTAAARVRMARVLLEKGANPDVPMTTWKGNRMVTTVPFCELGNSDFNHEMRMLLLQYGEQDLKKRMLGWPLKWAWYREDLVQVLTKVGMAQSDTSVRTGESMLRQEPGTVPLIDLIRKGDVEGVRLALESGVSIEVSPRARRYGQEPLFNIPVRRKDSPEAAVEIARLLIEAGADINALNRRGNSLRIHYDRYYSKASKALCAYLKERGSLIHPDSPMRKAEVEAEEKARQERILARLRRLNGEPEPPTPAEPTTPAEPQPEPPTPVEPTAPAEPQPEPPTPVEPTTPAEPQLEPPTPVEPTTPAEPQPEPPTPAEPTTSAEPQPEPPAPVEPTTSAEPQSEPPTPAEPTAPAEPQPEPPAPVEQSTAVAPASDSSAGLQNEHTLRLMAEVQAQLTELQSKYEAEQRARDEQSAAQTESSSEEP